MHESPPSEREQMAWLMARVDELEAERDRLHTALTRIAALNKRRREGNVVVQTACGHLLRAVEIAETALAGPKSGEE